MKKVIQQDYSNLISDIAVLIEQGRKTAVRFINSVLIPTYWLIGRKIIE